MMSLCLQQATIGFKLGNDVIYVAKFSSYSQWFFFVAMYMSRYFVRLSLFPNIINENKVTFETNSFNKLNLKNWCYKLIELWWDTNFFTWKKIWNHSKIWKSNMIPVPWNDNISCETIDHSDWRLRMIEIPRISRLVNI